MKKISKSIICTVAFLFSLSSVSCGNIAVKESNNNSVQESSNAVEESNTLSADEIAKKILNAFNTALVDMDTSGEQTPSTSYLRLSGTDFSSESQYLNQSGAEAQLVILATNYLDDEILSVVTELDTIEVYLDRTVCSKVNISRTVNDETFTGSYSYN